MGSFDNIKNVGKKMAREGLCFSSTIETVKVSDEECTREPDIMGDYSDRAGTPTFPISIFILSSFHDPEKRSNRYQLHPGGSHEISGKPYTFSDGIGKISGELRDDVCAALSETLKGKKPSAFQVRIRAGPRFIWIETFRRKRFREECRGDSNFATSKQIRYQGAKGMVAYDPNLKGRRLVLRDSMVKFDCPSTETASFEVIKYSEESE